jgi:MYXO-CTERM domain-containing protein
LLLWTLALLPLGCGLPAEVGYEPDGPLGAVGLPLSFIPNLPFPSGTTSTVTQGQNGSFSHQGNLSYALDFGSLGFGPHVLAVGDGTVVYAYEACAASSIDCNGGWGNAVVVDHGNGEFSKVTHLEPSSVPAEAAVGSTVCRGAYLGNVGSSGNSTGPHIHFQFQSTGDLNGPSIQFERFEETTGVPVEDDQITSQNVEGGGCGPQPGCEISIGAGVTVVDDQTDCFGRTGQYWWEEAYGNDAHHWYTYTIAAAAPDSVGTWEANVVVADQYLVEVFVPDNPAALTGALRYEVLHDGVADSVTIDQASNRGQWVALGTYAFAVSHDQHVRTFDNTGEPYVDQNGPRLLCDAVRFTSQTACADECLSAARQCGGLGWQECGDWDVDGCLEWGGGAACEAGTSCQGAGDCLPGGAGGSSGAGGSAAGASDPGGSGISASDETGGCGCRVAQARGAGNQQAGGLLGAGLLALAGLRRRAAGVRAGRRSRPAPPPRTTC